MIETIYTIGVYGSTETTFFDTLLNAQVDLFIDIRQRRGVRGKKYAYVNSTYLQEKLKILKIDYLHYKALAPTPDIRQLQKEADRQSKIAKKNREALGDVFIEAYKKEILSQMELKDFLNVIENHMNICLFCVEQHPKACHRSLVSVKLKEIIDVPLVDLIP